ncbi:MAG: TonB family protein [Myxococcales bacterium]|nr:TonB family protein [Myxococcales bacterium]
MASKKNALTFRITGPDGTTLESRSELESVILGSGAGAAVKIPDPKVSNLHVMLKVEKSGIVTAIDLGSEHGTKLGDEPINNPVALASGDVLHLGGSKVKVLFGDADSTEAVPNDQLARDIAAKAMPLAPPPPAAAPAIKPAPKPLVPRALAGTGKNAAILFNDPLPAEATPAEDSKVLQVALLWGDTLINVGHFADGVPVTIGEAKRNHFHVFAPSIGDSFTLVRSKGSTMQVDVPHDAGVVVSTRGDSHKSKEQLRAEGKLRGSDGPIRADSIELGLHDRAQVSFENVAFIIRYVRPSAAVAVGRMEEADFTFFKISSICIMAFIAMVAAMLLTPQGEWGTSDDIFQNPSKYVKLLVKPEKKIEIKKFKDLSGLQEGAKAKEKEGKFGKQDAKKDQADPSKKGSPVVDANKREEDRKKVMAAGLLGALGGAAGGASNVFGPGGLGTGINNALGGLQGGAGLGDAHGVGGLGSRGTGPGGGGTGLGLGGLGTKGTGRGAGGYGSIDLGGRGKDTTRVVPGKTTVVGGLSKDVIAKVIKRHQNEIKFCYEQELQKVPDLAGKVAVVFTIDPAGAVSEANVSESSLGSANAENCMLSRIRRWKFPEPQGGGVVTVSFPWVFKSAGADSGDE